MLRRSERQTAARRVTSRDRPAEPRLSVASGHGSERPSWSLHV